MKETKMLFKTTSTNKNDLSGRARLIPGNPPPESKKKSAVKPSSIQRAKQVAQEKFSKFTGFFGKKIFSTTSNKKRSGADSELSPLNSGQSSPGSIGELDDFNDETSTCSDMSEKENCSDENQAIISSSISTFSLKKAKEIKYIKDLPQPALTPFQKKMSDHLFNYINDYRQIESFLNNGAYVNAKQAGSGDTMLHLVLNEKLKIKKDFTDLYKKSSPSENPVTKQDKDSYDAKLRDIDQKYDLLIKFDAEKLLQNNRLLAPHDIEEDICIQNAVLDKEIEDYLMRQPLGNSNKV